jgi:hypothetical protein
MKRALALVLAIAAAAIVATAGSARHSEWRALHVTKECSDYHGHVGEFCTIKSSNISAIEPEMKVVYLAALPASGVLDSDIVLSSGHGGAALGHVVLDLGAAQGRVTFSVGTGRFAGFRARAVVSLDRLTGLWHWDGSYSFARSDDDDDDNDD